MKVYFYKNIITHDCVPGSYGSLYNIYGICPNNGCSFCISPSILINLFDYEVGDIMRDYLFPAVARPFTNYYKERIDITDLIKELES